MPIIQEVEVGVEAEAERSGIQDQAQKHSELKDSQDEEITPDNDSLEMRVQSLGPTELT